MHFGGELAWGRIPMLKWDKAGMCMRKKRRKAFVGQVPDPEFKNPRWNENIHKRKQAVDIPGR